MGSGQTFPEIIPQLCDPLAQEEKTTTNQISFMPYSKAHVCSHTSVYTFSHTHSFITWLSYWHRGWTAPGVQEKKGGKKNSKKKRKEKGKDILINPTCFYKQTRKWKGKSLYRALAYPISDFSGGEKLRQVADSIEKPRERDAGEETDGGREGRERVQNNR